MSRQLWQCNHAKVLGSRIRCDKGYKLGSSEDGTITLGRAATGEPLCMAACQECTDFDSMGKALSADERGWVK